ncbi:flagellar basal body rod protein FlgG [Bacillus swezeyi]|uniref:Flagellar basal-body rod protein FlgF n=1 Tax=Bacillus swezeyi TaxID=1925020 RepID=A0A1R1RZA3_9BACI|nr:flagellar basal body rod protein FlgG [Bacillus swezeyi]MEC1260873.1 flagellar basal body rod protein FlgG [Bacillus swezeyi]MED1741824.1 flagellar basal body rod protein FlgG [Bacillus swezeyi]MED2928810.1 flagellar basal body rod protein FlgG [Bacillus swezeyi]MED2964332.1 flagellar basal body rod protein FlgG [Bacillus swezeyi]MED2975946.1 flagellar basal body rod protein FlgG [Bacillus swezeyi]
MLRSLYSGISGMKNFQTKLDVIANNISNVNTAGYKKSRVTFKDIVSQQLAGASASTADRGSVNGQQVGLGGTIGSIDIIHTNSAPSTTGRQLDMTITGDGYFRVGTGDETYYTRSGNFYLSDEGDLVTVDGLFVLTADDQRINIPADAQSFSIATDGTVTYVDQNNVNQPAGQISLATFSNTAGLTKAGDNLYRDSLSSGNPQVVTPGEGSSGKLQTSALEMSNVDLSEEFSEMIISQRGFQANAKIITTSDEILQELVNLKR